jgi:hypothetical protein
MAEVLERRWPGWIHPYGAQGVPREVEGWQVSPRPVTLLPPPLNVDRLACNLSYDGHPLALIEAVCERAAILEYDGKMPREQAEAAAVADLQRAARRLVRAGSDHLWWWLRHVVSSSAREP